MPHPNLTVPRTARGADVPPTALLRRPPMSAPVLVNRVHPGRQAARAGSKDPRNARRRCLTFQPMGEFAAGCHQQTLSVT